MNKERLLGMTSAFQVGDHVEWNSEAGHVHGTIKKKITSAIKFKGTPFAPPGKTRSI
jgi:Hypervirulence associated proteins TUDOR domain